MYFDYIIVGAGPAGITNANHLIHKGSVMLLDKDIKPVHPLLETPILAGSKITALKSVHSISIAKNHQSIQNESVGGNAEINGLIHYLGPREIYPTRETYNKLVQLHQEAAAASQLKFRTSFITPFDRSFIDGTTSVDSGPVTYRTGRYFRSQYKLHPDITFIKFNMVPSSLTRIKENIILVNGKSVKFGKLVFCVSPTSYQKFRSFFSGVANRKLYDHVNMRIKISNPYNGLNLNSGFSRSDLKLYQLVKYVFGSPSLFRGTGATSFKILEYGLNEKKYFKLQLLWFSLVESGKRFERNSGSDISFSVTPFNPYYASHLGTHTTTVLSKSDIVEIAQKVTQIVHPLGLLKKTKNASYKFVKDQMFGSMSSGYHVIGGGPMQSTQDFDLFKPVEITGYPHVYFSGALVMSEYQSSNIEAPVIALSNAHAKYIGKK